MAERTRNPGDTAVAIPKARTAKKVAKPPLFKVLLHNDDFTTMEFVVEVLRTVFRHDVARATRIMLHIHQRGVGVAGVLSDGDRRDEGREGDVAWRARPSTRCCARSSRSRSRW